ncbi:phosphatidylserine decarboxylase proenzyme, mitochondrial-like [Styela clava]
MTANDARKILFAAVFRYVAKNTPRPVKHGWTATVSTFRNASNTLPPLSPIGRLIYNASWKQPSLLPKSWKTAGIRRIASCPNLFRMFGLPYKGQGLKKHAATVKESKKLQQFIDNRKKEQEWGRKYFPVFPDVITFFKAAIIATSGIFVGWIFYPDIVDRKSALNDPTLRLNSAIMPQEKRNIMLKVYLGLPLRAISRAWGKANQSMNLPVTLRPYFLGLFTKAYGVNMEEALDSNLKNYANLSEFFRRAIKSEVRPIDYKADLVSPVDGTVLNFGEVTNGLVEQVKGVHYSLQKFLGPLHADPVHQEWGEKDLYQHNWCTVPLENYMKAIMHNPTENSLYHCVIYLAPGDYHRFHSPANWTVQHRRHFPGDLLSVSPKIASMVPSLFVLNERVGLLGKWQHGFFSMTAVGATNVGSVEIYGDITLKTNRPKRVYGGYYDEVYNNVEAQKGLSMGEFNLGSTIVLIFEAPKDFKYRVEAGQKIQFGKAL